MRILDENDTEITSANIESNEDENGDIVLKRVDANNNQVDLQLKNIKIVTTKPIIEGVLKIKAIKAIKGNCGYDKQTLKTLNKLTGTIKVVSNNEEEIINTDTLLKDTKTVAKLEISNNNLSTLETNKGVQITATLVTNSSEYDLYKNPTINIELPKEIENIKITSAKVLYNEGLKTVKNKIVTNEEGVKTIELAFSGEQTSFGNNVYEGMQVVIFADLTLNKLTPNKKANMKMIYTNENGNENQYENNLELNLNSKSGVLAYSKISDFNDNGDVLETFGGDVPTGKLDVNGNEKKASASMAIINNYEYEIANVSIIGTILENNEVYSNLIDDIVVNFEGAKVFYSEEANEKDATWKESKEKARLYKIDIPNSELKSGDKIEFYFQFSISDKINYNEKFYMDYKVNYDYLGQNMTIDSGVCLETEENSLIKMSNTNAEKETIEITNGVYAQISAQSGGKYLKDGDEIYEGENIKYNVVIINNSGNDLSNLLIISKHTNSVMYDLIKQEAISTTNEPAYNYYLRECPDVKEKEYKIEKLNNGESTVFEYEFSVKKEENGSNDTQGHLEIMFDGIEKKEIKLLDNKIEQADIQMLIKYQESEKLNVKSKGNLPYDICIKNLSNEIKKDIIIEINVSEIGTVDFSNIKELNRDNLNYEILEFNDETKQLKLKIKEIEPNKEENIMFWVYLQGFDIYQKNKEISIYGNTYLLNHKDIKYNSNYSNRVVNQDETQIDCKISANKNNEEELKNGDKIDFYIEVSNKGILETYINICNFLPDGVYIDSLKEKNDDGSYTNIEINNNKEFDISREFNPDEVKNFILSTSVNTENCTEKNIEIYVEANTNKSNVIEYSLDIQDKNIDEGQDEQEDQDDSDDQKNNDDKENYNYISGRTWVDLDKNGIFDLNDKELKNIDVYLIEANTGKILQKNTINNENGNYKFDKVSNGKYFIAFKYDNKIYRPTIYHRENVESGVNSDVIKKEINLDGVKTIVALTDIIEINSASIDNINAGFIQNERFDLRLDKYISKVIVENSAGTSTKSYEDTKLAKVEINSKKLINSLVLIEYSIKITNEGELDGYIGDIVDYIPKDLKFNSEMNKDWFISTDGALHNITLANEKISAGQEKELKLILTKTMTNNNTGTVINVAEIGKATNDLSIDDCDSTPGNKVEDEDDMSKAEVIISISTGMEFIVTILIIITLILVISLFIILKRKEVKKWGKN